VKLLLCTGCEKIVFIEPYAGEEESRKLWTRSIVVRPKPALPPGVSYITVPYTRANRWVQYPLD
jgi:hypothetical protein